MVVRLRPVLPLVSVVVLILIVLLLPVGVVVVAEVDLGHEHVGGEIAAAAVGLLHGRGGFGGGLGVWLGVGGTSGSLGAEKKR